MEEENKRHKQLTQHKETGEHENKAPHEKKRNHDYNMLTHIHKRRRRGREAEKRRCTRIMRR